MTDKQVGGKNMQIELIFYGQETFKILLLETNVFTNNSTGITTKDMSLSLVVNVYVLSNELTNWLTKISPEKKCASVQIYNHVKAFYQCEQYVTRNVLYFEKFNWIFLFQEEYRFCYEVAQQYEYSHRVYANT